MEKLAELVKNNKQFFATTLLVICIVVISISIWGFSENKMHDGLPALLISCTSYFTTTLSVFVALMIL